MQLTAEGGEELGEPKRSGRRGKLRVKGREGNSNLH
jgi:hypothetical protein